MKKIISVFLSIAIIISAFSGINTIIAYAQTYTGYCGTNVEYSLNTETGILTISGSGDMLNYSSYNDTPWASKGSYVKKAIIEEGVTSIGDMAFYYICENLKSITLPSTLKHIGNAFGWCKNLESVVIPNIEMWCNLDISGNYNPNPLYYAHNLYLNDTLLTNLQIPNEITKINNPFGFSNCESIKKVSIPSSLTSIPEGCFRYCYGIESFEVDDENPNFCSVNDMLCNKNVTTLIQYPFASSEKSVVLPNTIEIIGDYAFYECNQLNDITLSNNLKSIGVSAFAYCNNLSRIKIPQSLTDCHNWAFSNCGIREVYIDDLVSWLNIDFYGSSNTESNPMNCGADLYLNDKIVTDLIIPETIDRIKTGAFSGCTSIKRVFIPDTIKTIGDAAFICCENLEYANIPSGITAVPYECFMYCHNLKCIEIPESVTSFGTYSFYECNNISICYSGGSMISGGSLPSSYKAYFNSSVSSDGYAFLTDNKTNVKEYFSSDKDYIVPSIVKSFNSDAFSNVCPENIFFFKDISISNIISKIKDANIYTYKKTDLANIATINDLNVKYLDEYECSKNEHLIKDVCDVVAPTCVQNGTKNYRCYICGTILRQDSISKLGHDFKNYIYNYDATCTTDGTETAKCDRCDETNTRIKTNSLLGHNYSVSLENAIPATCLSSGKITDYKCSRCDSVKIGSTTNKLGHSFTNYIYNYDATCLNNGTETAKCDRCNETKTRTKSYSSLGHDYSVSLENGVPATCLGSGRNTDYKCSRCDSVKTGGTIAKLGHSFTTYIDNKDATCTTDGTETAKCDRCDETNTRVIHNSAFGHSVKVDEYKAPTCTETGLTEGSHCSTCDEVFVAQEIINANGHNWTSWSVVNAPNGCKDGLSIRICNTCNVIENLTIPASGTHNYVLSSRVAPTCVNDGKNVYTCTICQSSYMEIVPATGQHIYRANVTKATTSKNGSIVYKCDCGNVESTSTIYYPKTITLSATKYTYDGKVKKPTVKIVDANGKTIAASNYTITYASGRKNVGKYTVKIAFKGNYSGTKSLSFVINPKNTRISKLTATKGGFKATIKKYTTQTTGYQIRYSTKSNMSGAKTVTIAKNTTTSKSVTGLSKGKKYFVQVRTFKTVNGTKYYSAWSGNKTVTTKK